MGLHKSFELRAGREEGLAAQTAGPTRLWTTALLTGGIALVAIGLIMMAFSFVSGHTANLSYAIGIATWLMAGFNGAFHTHITGDEFRNVPLAALSALVAGAAASLLVVTGLVGHNFGDIAAASAVSALSLIVGILCGRIILRGLWSRGLFRSNALVVGSGVLSRELAIELRHRPELGIDLVDFVAIEDIDFATQGTIADVVAEKLWSKKPDRLIVGQVDNKDEDLLPALRLAGVIGTRVYVLPRLFSMGVGTSMFKQEQLRGYPLQRVNRSTHPELALAVKRGIDVVVSAAGLALLSPVLVAAAIAVKLSSRGDLLFWQERVGHGGRIIRIPKFRSMHTSANSDFEWRADSRTTRVGRFLRRSAIDELPQLWSVLRGDMSLVGPRPERPAFAMKFAEEHLEYASRHRMRTGMTGLAQIAGLRGDTPISERAKFDNRYIDQWSLCGDFVIMARTIGAIIDERARTTAQRELASALTWAVPLESSDVLGSSIEFDQVSPLETEQTRSMQRV